jgi:predicted NAD-dependent protein-ADP-ribosyltransferase YbiA (DUF1768 family)
MHLCSRDSTKIVDGTKLHKECSARTSINELLIATSELETRVEHTLEPVVLPNRSSSPSEEQSVSICSKRKREDGSDADSEALAGVRQLQFYSRSTNMADLGQNIPANWRKILSNFHQMQLIIGDSIYPTPEHAFHAAKALCSSKPSMALMFIVGGTVGPLPLDAKRAGGKVAYKQYGTILNDTQWQHKRDAVQQNIIDARLQQHREFLSILTAARDQNITLVHFDRSGHRSYWGGTIDSVTGGIKGTNRLGVLLMETMFRLPPNK